MTREALLAARRPFVFLDRDGTLVRDTGYPHRLEDYALLPGAARGARRLSEAGFGLAIVTNQSGIGRGLFCEADFRRFQARLLSDLARAGVPIAASYFCPHHPEAGCSCRKPATGLLERARRELGADLHASWVIGDGACDVELARRAGCRGAIRIDPSLPQGGPCPPLRARDLAEAAEALLARR